MTIKDVTTSAPSILDGKGLEKMFEIRKELQALYIEKEKLPDYPVDINTKASQILLRDFLYRITEEVSEVYEKYMEMVMAASVNDLSHIHTQLIAYNEELADVHNFMMQLLLYAHITPDSMYSYYSRELHNLNLYDIFFYEKDILRTIWAAAGELNARHATTNMSFRGVYTIDGIPEELKYLTEGGRKIDPDLIPQHAALLFDLTFGIGLAGNKLKNKAWRDTILATDGKVFQETIMKIWECWMRYLDFAGLTPRGLFTIYYKKAQVNIERIKSGY